jgi:N-acyl-D-amino-acid deacylase
MLIAVVSLDTSAAQSVNTDQEVRASAAKAVAVVQKSSSGWFRKQSCVSCHHQMLPLMALKRVREHGVPIDEKEGADQLQSSLKSIKRVEVIQGIIHGGLPADRMNELFDRP